jgi:hypothetical protein
MKVRPIVYAAILLGSAISARALGYFEVPVRAEDEPKAKAEVAAQDRVNHKKIDFAALNAFVGLYAKGRGIIVVGGEHDRYAVDLRSTIPSAPWRLVDPLHVRYVSGSWYWELSGGDLVVWFSDEVLALTLKIRIVSKDQFAVIEENIQDRRDLLDG